MVLFLKFSSLSAPTKVEELTAGSDEKKTQRSPAVPASVFSSDPAVSSSTFVGAEREENLSRNDPDKSEFTVLFLFFFCLSMYVRSLVYQNDSVIFVFEKERE